MLSAYDAQNRFVCYGTYVVWESNGETYGVFPDDPEAVFDDQGHELVAAKRSALYGYKMCPLPRREDGPAPLALRVVSTPFVCVCAEDWVMGFSCWYVHKSGAVTIKFAQYGDPRLNGAPVVDRKTKELVGMYLVRSWVDETKAECVPCDLFFDPSVSRTWDPRRAEGVRTEIESGWAEHHQGAWNRIPRALEINDWVFCETHDRKAKWVTHVYPDREYVCEDECRYLADPFSEVVAKIQRGDRTLRWSNGSTIEIQREPRGVGFFLEFRILPLASETPPTPPATPCKDAAEDREEGYPCVDWY